MGRLLTPYDTAAIQTTEYVVGGGDHDDDLVIEKIIVDVSGGVLDNGDLGNIGALTSDAADFQFGSTFSPARIFGGERWRVAVGLL